MATPGEIRISLGKSITLEQARALGLGPCIERMVHFTDHLRRLRVDQFEYAAMKVIILLSSGELPFQFQFAFFSFHPFFLTAFIAVALTRQTRAD